MIGVHEDYAMTAKEYVDKLFEEGGLMAEVFPWSKEQSEGLEAAFQAAMDDAWRQAEQAGDQDA